MTQLEGAQVTQTERRVARLLVSLPTLYPWWDAVTAVALIFTALVTPYEVGFLPPAEDALNGLWLLNRAVDLVFIFDMLTQFCTMRKMAVEKAVDANVEWEVDMRVIAREYVCSFWFPLDVLSIAPSGFEIVPVMNSDSDHEGGGIRALRTMRSLRLIKLVRLVKSTRVIARVMEFVSLSSTSQTAIGLMLQSLLLCHWFACIIMISTTFSDSPRGTWLFTYGYCTPIAEEGEGGNGEHGSDALGAWVCVEPNVLYLIVWRWSMGLVFHNTIPMFPDPGPFEPTFLESNIYQTKFTEAEDIMLIVLKLIGLGFWSFTISKLIHAITVLGNPATIAYQQDIDAVNRFCSFNRLPSHLARELRRYMYNTREVHSQRSRANIYSKLSPLLVAKVTKLLNRPLFASSLLQKAMRGLPPADGERLVSSIVTSSTTSVFSPGDRPPAGRIYIITEGVAIHKLFQLLSVGDCWGDEDVMLQGEQRKVRETKSMTYLRVLWVERAAFRKLEEDFPEAYGRMRMHAIWKRARRILRQYLQKHKSATRALPSAAAQQPVDALSLPSPVMSAGRTHVQALGSVGVHRQPSVGGSVSEEVMQSVDTIGGLMLATQRGVAEQNQLLAEDVAARHEALAADVASVAELARASHAAVLHLSEQMEQIQAVLGGGAHEPGRSWGSPGSARQRQEVARTRAAFRALRYSMPPNGPPTTNGVLATSSMAATDGTPPPRAEQQHEDQGLTQTC